MDKFSSFFLIHNRQFELTSSNYRAQSSSLEEKFSHFIPLLYCFNSTSFLIFLRIKKFFCWDQIKLKWLKMMWKADEKENHRNENRLKLLEGRFWGGKLGKCEIELGKKIKLKKILNFFNLFGKFLISMKNSLFFWKIFKKYLKLKNDKKKFNFFFWKIHYKKFQNFPLNFTQFSHKTF